MANPTPSPNEPLPATVHDAADRFAQQVNKLEIKEKIDQISDAAHGAKNAVNDFFDDAYAWFKSNGGKATVVVATATAAGLIGYYIGRNSQSETGEVQDL